MYHDGDDEEEYSHDDHDDYASHMGFAITIAGIIIIIIITATAATATLSTTGMSHRVEVLEGCKVSDHATLTALPLLLLLGAV